MSKPWNFEERIAGHEVPGAFQTSRGKNRIEKTLMITHQHNTTGAGFKMAVEDAAFPDGVEKCPRQKLHIAVIQRWRLNLAFEAPMIQLRVRIAR